MHLRKRRGQALVEFALTVPLLILLVGGIIDMGWLLNHQLQLTNASREGARVGALGLDDDAVQQTVDNYLAQASFGTPYTLTINQAGQDSQVRIESNVPLFFGTVGPELTLRGETVMRRE